MFKKLHKQSALVDLRKQNIKTAAWKVEEQPDLWV